MDWIRSNILNDLIGGAIFIFLCYLAYKLYFYDKFNSKFRKFKLDDINEIKSCSWPDLHFIVDNIDNGIDALWEYT
jgi:hypothetical protein